MYYELLSKLDLEPEFKTLHRYDWLTPAAGFALFYTKEAM